MVEKLQMISRRRRTGKSDVPLNLPPRWGEGVAPPTTPHFSPETSPVLVPVVVNTDVMHTSPDSDHNTRSSHPASGAQLLDDLHRRLMAQSVNGTLPRRPRSSDPGGRRRVRGKRQKTNNYLMTLPVPDLLQPSSAFNHPSRHTQYSLVRLHQHNSPSPTNSESPPLQASHLSFPSPPLVRVMDTRQPLTSTMIGSPESSSSQSSHMTQGHANSPASPELSSIPPRLLNVTPYQNIENGIAYIPSQATTSSGLAVANLSRFNVSPPNSNSRPVRTKLKTKTVSWVSDRKLKAKHISDDRKIVKSQVRSLSPP